MELAFDITIPLGFAVRCTRRHWNFIATVKHPSLAELEWEVARTLADPDQVRRSRHDHDVFLSYRRLEHRWLCVVVRRSGRSGFVVTTYPTDAIKAETSYGED